MLTLQNLFMVIEIRGENMESNVANYHIPALLKESVDLLDIRPDGVYADATFGGGGHSREILRRLGPEGRLFGFDRDRDALCNVPDDPRFTFVLSDFRFMRNFLKFYGYEKIDGIIADLGVSFHHFDSPERGFSFRADAPLDMRMNSASPLTAREIVNQSSEDRLRDIFRSHTDLRSASEVARRIVAARKERPLETTLELVEAVVPALDPRSQKKELAQVFQAIRIVTNNEMESLNSLLEQSEHILKRNGRFVVLTYHSGEDRKVKDFFKTGNLRGEIQEDLIFGGKQSPWKLLNKNPIVASAAEVEENPRARSAKLRAAILKK